MREIIITQGSHAIVAIDLSTQIRWRATHITARHILRGISR